MNHFVKCVQQTVQAVISQFHLIFSFKYIRLTWRCIQNFISCSGFLYRLTYFSIAADLSQFTQFQELIGMMAHRVVHSEPPFYLFLIYRDRGEYEDCFFFSARTHMRNYIFNTGVYGNFWINQRQTCLCLLHYSHYVSFCGSCSAIM